jgi:hypothetical protein
MFAALAQRMLDKSFRAGRPLSAHRSNMAQTWFTDAPAWLETRVFSAHLALTRFAP